MSASAAAVAKQKPLPVFVSYSRKDEAWLQKLETALAQMQREGLIAPWDDRRIEPGDEWAGKIDERLRAAAIVILLVSPDFLESGYCNDIELKTALERHAQGLARVIPVIVRPCDWKTAAFGKLQALPKRGKPVARWKDKDEALLDVVNGLRRIAESWGEIEPEPAGQREKTRRQRKVAVWLGAGLLIGVILVLGCVGWSGRLVTQGNDRFSKTDWDKAREKYQAAARWNPWNAEAYFGLGLVDDIEQDWTAAAAKYERANEISERPEYRINWANDLYKLRDWDGAIKKYGDVADSPYAALGAAKAYRLKEGTLDKALEKGRLALEWVNDAAKAAAPVNQREWIFTTDRQGIRVRTQREKVCYAQFELALTLYLMGRENQAQRLVEAGRESCAARMSGLAAELEYEAGQIAKERSELAGSVEEFLRDVRAAHDTTK